ncbi:MAG: bifunctional diguanylate cyclase/phosphodiesterase [Gammaproteobacteria bacterium]|nr:bifunctional diguanylate cyclase/phosphodiesterase [Gammaproteobacteria bacterium]
MNAKKKVPSNVIDLGRILRQKETEIELLQQTFTEIGSELNLNRVFQIVSERARKLINAETILIPIIDYNHRSYTYRGGSGKNAEEIVGESLPLNFGVCGWVLKHKKPWWQGTLKELSDDEKNRWEKEVGNILLVPLQGKKHFLGGISGLNKIGGKGFDKRDLNLLQLFAGIVSIAIENAMAVKKNEEFRSELKLLNSQLSDNNKQLEYLSLYDPVTALPNRSLSHYRITQDIKDAEFAGSNIGILLIDIDRFKDINDTYGHEQGDLLLNKIARRFEQRIRNHETLARLGGDEFIIVLPDHNRQQTIKRTEQFIHSLQEAFVIKGDSIVVNASIGIAIYPEHGNVFDHLLKHADVAMYAAKNSNISFNVYDPENDRLEKGHLILVSEARKALEEKNFELYYQAKVNARDGQIVSAEALGRWHSDTLGDVSPEIFIDILAESNLLDEYTYWAIETALAQAKKWQAAFRPVRIAVNLSPHTLMHPDFKQMVDRLVKDKTEGALLTFEITENLFLSEFDRVSDVLEYIRLLGVELSIDDYGTGYSSLSLLRRLKVSELKIDRSFIKDVAHNKDDEVIVHSTIELAHNLGLKVVAEGVETEETLDLLKKLGCDTIQGFLISRPLPVKEFNTFIKEPR